MKMFHRRFIEISSCFSFLLLSIITENFLTMKKISVSTVFMHSQQLFLSLQKKQLMRKLAANVEIGAFNYIFVFNSFVEPIVKHLLPSVALVGGKRNRVNLFV